MAGRDMGPTIWKACRPRALHACMKIELTSPNGLILGTMPPFSLPTITCSGWLNVAKCPVQHVQVLQRGMITQPA